ncbi:hypothetical protein M378DRAFT_8574 [Amanita muscaria Koide BX008]|uniref:Carboxymuconolactone decarboxylase-like domain-containing protein n=1 Tax=Amanita muscaria (strain Koide BX008) TaxID=946122 RepID=A0A0C2TMX6_AMAMK|nr:hypothetical protein M378DRAFT_8574 [Amanita muscaria Koide BX008]
MTVLATPAFLNRVKSIFPARSVSNPWFIMTAVVFSAANLPEEVPRVFAYAMEDVQTDQEKIALARKFREALFKSGLTSGYPKVINSLKALNDTMPEGLREKKVLRNVNLSLEEYGKIGKRAFTDLYGSTAQSVQSLLDDIYPDMGWFSNTIGYGLTYTLTDVLSPLETSYMLVASLITVDTPQQIIWHLANARRAGASLEEVRAVREIAMEVGRCAGIEWRNEVPEVLE